MRAYTTFFCIDSSHTATHNCDITKLTTATRENCARSGGEFQNAQRMLSMERRYEACIISGDSQFELLTCTYILSLLFLYLCLWTNSNKQLFCHFLYFLFHLCLHNVKWRFETSKFETPAPFQCLLPDRKTFLSGHSYVILSRLGLTRTSLFVTT